MSAVLEESVVIKKTEDDLKERLIEFLRSYYYNELMAVSQKGDAAIVVDFAILDRFDPLLSDMLLEQPEMVLQSMQSALGEIDLPGEQKIVVRIRNLPEERNIRIRNLRAKHLGKFMTIDCIVKSATEVKPQIYEVIFKCPDCGAKIPLIQDEQLVKQPFACECGRRGRFDMLEKKMFDMRWLMVDEPFEITTGEQPGTLTVFLQEDLTSPRIQKKTDPGNRLKITGVFRELPKRIKGHLGTKMETLIRANHIESAETEFDDIEISPEDDKKISEMSKDPEVFSKLAASTATVIYGYEEIKEAIILQLFGGVPHTMPDGTRLRSNIHILLTGDPGIGKTRLLQVAADIIPRGRYVSGKGVTGAGLTASVVKNEVLGGWILQAGALVLANKGLIAIDEFDKMTSDDQVAMHEAMSVSTISIAKASINATLPADTAVLAGANPKFGRFEAMQPIGEQINIPETLLSRFDLKFALRDIPNLETDSRITQHIIDSRITPEVITPVIDPLLLRKYIAYARKITNITLTAEAADLLKKFYNDMRNISTEGAIAITLRQFEALIRLSEASAKVRLDNKVTLADAERAIRLMKYSLMQLGTNPETGRIEVDRMEGGITSTQRSRIRVIMDIIKQLETELGKKEIDISDLKAEAQEHGVQNVDEIIDKLMHEGIIIAPRAGFIRAI
ncbi:MAG: minichromosome maintenance protein MCM [Candidatus Aenigmatarchaeota archaeon]